MTIKDRFALLDIGFITFEAIGQLHHLDFGGPREETLQNPIKGKKN